MYFVVSSNWQRFCRSSHQVCRKLSTLLKKSFREGVSNNMLKILSPNPRFLCVCIQLHSLYTYLAGGGCYFTLFMYYSIYVHATVQIFTGYDVYFQAGSSIATLCLPCLRLHRWRHCFLCSSNSKQLVPCHLLAVCAVYIQSVWF